MKAWRGFCAAIRKINKVSLYLAVFCIVAMTGLITTEIICRTVFNVSTLIADEYTGYLVCAMTFFGGAYALSVGSFLRIDILYDRFKGKFRKVMDAANWLIGLVYTSFLLYFCTSVFIYSWQGAVVSIQHSRTPLVYPQAIMVFGCVLLLIQVIIELVNVFVEDKETEEVAA
jgi:TRAP-type C4-dicarboxylate transport system permease small subunit